MPWSIVKIALNLSTCSTAHDDILRFYQLMCLFDVLMISTVSGVNKITSEWKVPLKAFPKNSLWSALCSCWFLNNYLLVVFCCRKCNSDTASTTHESTKSRFCMFATHWWSFIIVCKYLALLLSTKNFCCFVQHQNH